MSGEYNILHLFPNTGYLKRVITNRSGGNKVVYRLDDAESYSDIEAYDLDTWDELKLHKPVLRFDLYSEIEVYLKNRLIAKGTLLSFNNGSIKLLIAKQDNTFETAIINKFDVITGKKNYNSIKIDIPDRTTTPVIISKLNSFSWTPKYNLVVDENKLLNFSLNCKVNSVEFHNDYLIKELYLHINSTQEKRAVYNESVSYMTQMSSAPKAALRSSNNDDINSEQQDMVYKVELNSNANSLNSFNIWKQNKLDNFREVYCIDVYNGNDKAYRSYLFNNKELYMPPGNVKILNRELDLISVGNISDTYMDEKLISVMKDSDILVSVELQTENIVIEEYASTEYNAEGYNVTGKTVNKDENLQTVSIRESTVPVTNNGGRSVVNSNIRESTVPVTNNGSKNVPNLQSKGKSVTNLVPVKNVVPKTEVPTKVNNILPTTPAPESFIEKEGSIVEDSEDILLLKNPYFKNSTLKIKERIQNDFFSIKLKNKKKKNVMIRLSYSYTGILKRVEPPFKEKRPSELIWEIELKADETKFLHGAVKKGTIIGY